MNCYTYLERLTIRNCGEIGMRICLTAPDCYDRRDARFVFFRPIQPFNVTSHDLFKTSIAVSQLHEYYFEITGTEHFYFNAGE